MLQFPVNWTPNVIKPLLIMVITVSYIVTKYETKKKNARAYLCDPLYVTFYIKSILINSSVTVFILKILYEIT